MQKITTATEITTLRDISNTESNDTYKANSYFIWNKLDLV